MLAASSWTYWTGNVLLFFVVLVGCYTDLRWRKLPNWLTLGSAFAGLLLQSLTRGVSGGIDSLAGWALGCALLFVPFALRAMGAGDVKMLGAVGAIGGYHFVLEATLYMALAGGAQALLLLILSGGLAPLARGVLREIVFALRAIVIYRTLPAFQAPTLGATLNEAGELGQRGRWRCPSLPYGVAIAAGALTAMAIQGYAI